MSHINVTPPENEWIREHFYTTIQEPYEQGDPLSLNYQAADRLLWANASHWAFNDVRMVAWGEQKENLDENGYDEETLLSAWNNTQDEYKKAWQNVNDTGYSVLAAPLEEWEFSRYIGYEQLEEKRDVESAASTKVIADLVSQILEKAKDMPGEPIHEISYEDVEPLLDTVEENRIATPYEMSLPEAGNTFSLLTRDYLDRGWLHASIMTGMISLIVYEVFHMVYQNEAPTVDDVHNALASLNQSASEPLHEYPAQFAWRGAVLAHDDPAFMITPVATDRVWPVIDEITQLLTSGDPVDWTYLEELEQRWEQTWIPVMEADETD